MVKSQALEVGPLFEGLALLPRLDERLLNEIICALWVAAQGEGERSEVLNRGHEGVAQRVGLRNRHLFFFLPL
jgi:hypothetical protein